MRFATASTFSTFGELVQHWREEEQAGREYLAGLSGDDLAGTSRHTTSKGEKREPLAILTGYGHSPGKLDFTILLNERR